MMRWKRYVTISAIVIFFSFIGLAQSDDSQKGQSETTNVEILLKTTWEEMRASLLAGDVEKALSYFTYIKRDDFREMFTQMDRKTIQRRFSGEFKAYSVEGRIANCGLIRIENGKRYSYPVDFVKNDDGVWRIAGF